ncbi:hypothetical protein, partial [Methanobrevibacter sp.]
MKEIEINSSRRHQIHNTTFIFTTITQLQSLTIVIFKQHKKRRKEMSQSKRTSQETLVVDPMTDLINKLKINDDFINLVHRFGFLGITMKNFAHLSFQRSSKGCRCLMCSQIIQI